MGKQSKHVSPAESIAWLDDDGRVKALPDAPYTQAVEQHEKHIQNLRNEIVLNRLGMKDIRVWLSEMETKVNLVMERLKLEDASASEELDTIKTV